MRKSLIAFAVVAAAVVGIFISCNKNPAGPAAQPRNVILSDGFEYGNDSLAKSYNAVAWGGGRGMMSTTTAAAHSGTHSITSDSAKTGIRPDFNFAIQDSIAGVEFYFMAKKAEHIPFFAGIGCSGSEWNGLMVILGIGTTANDSLQYIYEYQANMPDNKHVSFAALQFNKWYKFRVECNFNDTTADYYVNDSEIIKIKTTNVMSINRLFVMRDSLGNQGPGPQGPAEYYLDDYTLYKR